MSEFSETLRLHLTEAGVAFSPEQIEQCEAYYCLVKETNSHTNLTRITTEPEAAEQHFSSAARLLSFYMLQPGSRVIDIGTGAGFPGIPIKLLRPDIDMTLLDSARKKTDFIRAAANQMEINVTVLNARAEEAARTSIRAVFDTALSRAVAPLHILLELCIPFLRVGGVFAAWKGESFRQEIDSARHALSALFCRVLDSHTIGPGAVILIEKQKPTPDLYPRRFSTIKSHPL